MTIDIAGQLSGRLKQSKDDWTDGEAFIPRRGTARRKKFEKEYLADAMRYFRLPGTRFVATVLDARTLALTNAIVDRERLTMYRRMFRAGDAPPPIVVWQLGGTFVVLDGNHRTQAALDTKVYKLPALLRVKK